MNQFLFLCLLLPAVATAQVIKPAPKTGAKAAAKVPPVAHRQSAGLEGLGRFKINKTTPAVIEEVTKELGCTVQHAYSMTRLSAAEDSSVVFKLDYESSDEYPDATYHASACPDAQVFFIPNYSVAEIPLKGLCLTFYKGLLARIDVEGAKDLAEAFEVKYGAPKMDVTRTPVPCIYVNTGNRTSYTNETYVSHWYNGPLNASYTLSKYYNSECKPQYLSFLLLGDEQKMGIIGRCHDAGERAKTATINAAKRKKLGEL